MGDETIKGRCLCGGVKFHIVGDDISAPDLCHCVSCRRWSGHAWAGANVPVENLKITDKGSLAWFRATPHARRGFCTTCGASLFWHGDKAPTYKGRIGFSLGALDTPTGLRLKEHIFAGEKGDYYDLNDGLPQKQEL